QVRRTHAFELPLVQVREVGDPQCGRGDGGRGACDPVLRERSVVRPRGAGEPGAQISSDLVGEGGPGDPAATEVELVSCVRRREMYEFVGEFIVVLQRMHERRLIT